MRTILCSLLLASSVAVAAPVSIGVAPSGVVVRFDMQNSPGFIFVSEPFPGVEVGLILTPSGEKVQLAAGREDGRLVCTDSTGKDLGKVMMIPVYSMGVVLPPQYGCAVAAREAPPRKRNGFMSREPCPCKCWTERNKWSLSRLK